VPVPLVDPLCAVDLARDRARLEHRRVEAEPHGAAEVAGPLDVGQLLLHRGDHGLRAVGVELGGVGLPEAGLVAGELDHHALQPEAQAERRDPVGAGIGERTDLALEAADAEAARHADRVDVVQQPGGVDRVLALVGGDPPDLDLRLVGEPTGAQRLGHGEVGVVQVDVLADQGDRHLLLGVVDPAEQVVPDRPVDVAEG
jgi:hypothetical protein